ncbi:MAG: hypothetical protein R6U78_01660 [Bacteroidales bacterium]
MTPSDEDVIAAASKGFFQAVLDRLQDTFTAAIRWVKGYRKGEEVVDGIRWKYQHRRGRVTNLEPSCQNCDVEMKTVLGNLNDHRLHSLWKCPKCKQVVRDGEASYLAERARKAIEGKLRKTAAGGGERR